MKTVVSSTCEDWHTISSVTANSGHDRVAVYMPDVSGPLSKLEDLRRTSNLRTPIIFQSALTIS
jgi:hypothetical protein